MSLPTVSVITPTWDRHQLLRERCIPSVQGQVYGGRIEHVIVSDGPEPDLFLPGGRYVYDALPEHQDVVHWGVLPRRRGLELATGEVIAYLDDDNAYRPRHLELLVEALERTGADFAYGRMQCHRLTRRGCRPSHVLGSAPPALGAIDTSLLVHRRELLQRESWNVAGYASDWDLVDRWLEAGARWVHVPDITLDYYL